MYTKLTLNLDKTVIEKAKKYAKDHHCRLQTRIISVVSFKIGKTLEKH